MGAAQGFEPTLIAVAARCLRMPPESIDPSAPLTRYGLDSLTALEFAVAVTEVTGVDLPEDLLFEAPSIRQLALQLLHRAPAPDTAAERVRRMHADAVLGADIDPTGLPVEEPQAVLLTGANGFLGTHVLQALLDAQAGEVICFVRATDDAGARERIDEARRRHALGPVDGRVRPLAADIGQPGFGLAPVVYDELARRPLTIVHCAAEVNWAAPYERLAAANVEATRGLLRLACTTVAKPFHFLSSAAAGYSTRTDADFTELSPVADPHGIHLGYGQSKWVAERLVEAARGRGLTATVYRPSLIAGHSVTGLGNDDDLFARMLRGCVALGHAPDIDWPVDACPVEFVARAVALNALASPPTLPVLHLRNPHPACWSEAVLWMNLRGYPVRLESYAQWIERVRSHVLGAEHPLHALRAFLTHRPAGEGGRYLGELYARPHVREMKTARSDAFLAGQGTTCSRLGAALLERYFDRWAQHGLIPEGARARSASVPWMQAGVDRNLETLLRSHFFDSSLRIETSVGGAFGGDYSIIGELGSWRAGSRYAMQARRVGVRHADGRRSVLDVVLKTKLEDAVVLDVMEQVAGFCEADLGRAFSAYRNESEFVGARSREIALYQAATGALKDHTPHCFGTLGIRAQTLVLERVHPGLVRDAVNDTSGWTEHAIEATLRGLSCIHGQWVGQEAQLARYSVVGSNATPGAAALDWWAALSAYGRPWVESWLGSEAARRHHRALLRLKSTLAALAEQPRTLVHGDFNPRNLVLRSTALGPQLCVFDWELAAYAAPQRDLVEFLCYALDPAAPRDEIERYIGLSRRQFEHSAGIEVDPELWLSGVRAAVAEFSVRRLPMYFMAHRFRPQRFLRRVWCAWWRLASVVGDEP